MKQSQQIQREFQSTSRSILSQVSRGVLVGLVVGAIVSSFRFFIEHLFHIVQGSWKKSDQLDHHPFDVSFYYFAS